MERVPYPTGRLKVGSNHASGELVRAAGEFERTSGDAEQASGGLDQVVGGFVRTPVAFDSTRVGFEPASGGVGGGAVKSEWRSDGFVCAPDKVEHVSGGSQPVSGELDWVQGALEQVAFGAEAVRCKVDRVPLCRVRVPSESKRVMVRFDRTRAQLNGSLGRVERTTD